MTDYWPNLWKPLENNAADRFLHEWDANEPADWSFRPMFGVGPTAEAMYRVDLRRTRSGKWWEVSFEVLRATSPHVGALAPRTFGEMAGVAVAPGYPALQAWWTEASTPAPLTDEAPDALAVPSQSGRSLYVVRCPHCTAVHMHGAGDGHRVAECSGSRAGADSGYVLRPLCVPAVLSDRTQDLTLNAFQEELPKSVGKPLPRSRLGWHNLAASWWPVE